MSNEETLLIAFKAITNFVNDLASVFGKKHKPLQLYNRLISHTKITNETAIEKHINIFSKFCSLNKSNIMEKTLPLESDRIVYSDNVYIDMRYIFSLADDETSPVIWRHLLTIYAIFNPDNNVKELLRVSSDVKEELPAQNGGGDVLGGMNIFGLLGSVQGMMNMMAQQAGDAPEAKQALALVENLMKATTNLVTGNGSPADIDLGQMSQMMGMMMNSLGNPNANMPNNGNEINKKDA